MINEAKHLSSVTPKPRQQEHILADDTLQRIAQHACEMYAILQNCSAMSSKLNSIVIARPKFQIYEGKKP